MHHTAAAFAPFLDRSLRMNESINESHCDSVETPCVAMLVRTPSHAMPCHALVLLLVPIFLRRLFAQKKTKCFWTASVTSQVQDMSAGKVT
mmetsp:Transcript_2466/g.5747  ORF Transcript_2466/g.5747 Transcript_2466/m.5747 type:complete len:91 (+) Transcript_2466:298-570(+)